MNSDGRDIMTENPNIAIDMYNQLRNDPEFNGDVNPIDITKHWLEKANGDIYTTKREKLARATLARNKSAKAMAKLVAHGLYPINKQPSASKPQYYYNRFM